MVNDIEASWLAAITTEGRMLVFKVQDLPQLARGKGNKIINIPSARVQSREEYVVGLAVITEQNTLKIMSGKRHISLKFKEMDHYFGERGRRGNKLPRGFQKVDGVEVV